ncbi:MAG: DUF86 domain-containing protein [Ignavibacteria bacterium]|nr:DUF86 domain-containing protein [Ignavibacteria bacterium]
MSEKDLPTLMNIIDSANKIKAYVKNIKNADVFFEDEKTFDAVMMNFIIMGESVSKLSDGFKSKNKSIPWNKIKDFRNLIAHDYFGIDAEEVWQIIKKHLPKLLMDLKGISK